MSHHISAIYSLMSLSQHCVYCGHIIYDACFELKRQISFDMRSSIAERPVVLI